MIRSMTGFGRRQAPWQDGSVTVEMRSVNHRFLEIACRLPRPLSHLEDSFKKAIQQRCTRGRIDITVTVQGGKGRAGSVNLDQPLAKQYHQALRTLKKSLKLSGSIDLALMAGLRDVVSVSDQPAEDPKLAKMVQRLTTQALTDLDAMRTREGEALAEDMRSRVQTIREHKTCIAARIPRLAQETFDRMKIRVEKLLGSEIPDPPRLYQELAVYADRGDITEEIVRLDSHMIQFEETLNRAESVGKTLDFLLQEFGREVNTIGSKANDAEIAGHVVQMKAELERIREQVQNVELAQAPRQLPRRRRPANRGPRRIDGEFSSLSPRPPGRGKPRSANNSRRAFQGCGIQCPIPQGSRGQAKSMRASIISSKNKHFKRWLREMNSSSGPACMDSSTGRRGNR
jgi:uncharacterized protein (TIGR00255 family)